MPTYLIVKCLKRKLTVYEGPDTKHKVEKTFKQRKEEGLWVGNFRKNGEQEKQKALWRDFL